VKKHLGVPGTRAHLEALAGALAGLPSFDAGPLEAALRELAEARGLKAGTLIHATRVAVTGRAQSPGLFDVLELVGRERTLARLARPRWRSPPRDARPALLVPAAGAKLAPDLAAPDQRGVHVHVGHARADGGPPPRRTRPR